MRKRLSKRISGYRTNAMQGSRGSMLSDLLSDLEQELNKIEARFGRSQEFTHHYQASEVSSAGESTAVCQRIAGLN